MSDRARLQLQVTEACNIAGGLHQPPRNTRDTDPAMETYLQDRERLLAYARSIVIALGAEEILRY